MKVSKYAIAPLRAWGTAISLLSVSLFGAGGCERAAAPSEEIAEELRLAAPVLSIGGSSGDSGALLFKVAAVARAADGRFIVVDRGLSSIRVFDPDGKLLRTFGRRGGAPEEFGYVASAWLAAGDTLLVEDPANRRLTRWTPADGFQGAISLGGHAVRVYGVGSDGKILVGESDPEMNPAAGETIEDSVALQWFDPATGRMSEWRRVAAGKRYGGTLPDGRPIFVPLPFTTGVRVAVSGNTVLLGGDSVLFRYDLSTGRQDSVPVAIGAAPLTADMKRLFIKSRLQRGPPEPGAREFLSSLPYPAHLPRYDSILIDPSHRVWLRQYPTPDSDSTDWLAMAEGGVRARLRITKAVHPVRITGTEILAVTVDADSVQTISVIPVVQSARQRR